jgi:hypothetical protein
VKRTYRALNIDWSDPVQVREYRLLWAAKKPIKKREKKCKVCKVGITMEEVRCSVCQAEYIKHVYRGSKKSEKKRKAKRAAEFIGPVATRWDMKRLSSKQREERRLRKNAKGRLKARITRAKKREAFIGPPKPKIKICKFEWAKEIDTSTPEGNKLYHREYGRRRYREKTGSTGRKILSEDERIEARRIRRRKRDCGRRGKEHHRRKHQRSRDDLRDSYVKLRLGVKNPPQELIELKRVQMKIYREINRGSKI